MNDPTLVLNADESVWDIGYWNEIYPNIFLPLMNYNVDNHQIARNFIRASYDNPIGLVNSKTLPRPSVVVLPVYQLPHRRAVRWSRWNVFLRDKYMCAYCGRQCGFSEFLPRPELEHVVPRCLGGRSTFENTVTACQSCNSKKDSLTLKEFTRRTGLKLNVNPTKPRQLHPARFLYRHVNTRNVKDWIPYIPDAEFFISVMDIPHAVKAMVSKGL